MNDPLTNVVIRMDGESVGSFTGVSPPHVGETIEIGEKFADGERLDPGVTDWREWDRAEYETTLEAVVTDVTRHYHTGHDRTELTVSVDVELAG